MATFNHYVVQVIAALEDRPRNTWNGDDSIRARVNLAKSPENHQLLRRILRMLKKGGHIRYNPSTREWRYLLGRVCPTGYEGKGDNDGYTITGPNGKRWRISFPQLLKLARAEGIDDGQG